MFSKDVLKGIVAALVPAALGFLLAYLIFGMVD